MRSVDPANMAFQENVWALVHCRRRMNFWPFMGVPVGAFTVNVPAAWVLVCTAKSVASTFTVTEVPSASTVVRTGTVTAVVAVAALPPMDNAAAVPVRPVPAPLNDPAVAIPEKIGLVATEIVGLPEIPSALVMERFAVFTSICLFVIAVAEVLTWNPVLEFTNDKRAPVVVTLNTPCAPPSVMVRPLVAPKYRLLAN